MATTREALVETTCRLVRRQGVAATGLQQVIDESGAPRGSLYHHFPGGKVQLIAVAVRRSGELGAERIGQLAELAAHPYQVIHQFIDDFEASLTSSGFADGCPIATVALESSGTPGAIADAVDAAFTAWIDAFATMLAAGGLDQDQALEVATEVLAHVEGALVLSRALRSIGPLRVARRTIREVLELRGTT